MNEYYLRFPSVLKKALQMGHVKFPDDTLYEYEPKSAFRGIRMHSISKTIVTVEDFKSQIEREIPGCNPNDIEDYSCSCFADRYELEVAYKLPRKNKGISFGHINKEYGPYVLEEGSSHIHWYIFDNVDPSEKF